jgi:hypothetical protein
MYHGYPLIIIYLKCPIVIAVKGDEKEAYEKKFYSSCLVFFQLLEESYIVSEVLM